MLIEKQLFSRVFSHIRGWRYESADGVQLCVDAAPVRLGVNPNTREFLIEAHDNPGAHRIKAHRIWGGYALDGLHVVLVQSARAQLEHLLRDREAVYLRVLTEPKSDVS